MADINFTDLTTAQQDAICAWENAHNGDCQYKNPHNYRYARTNSAEEVTAYEARKWRGNGAFMDVELETPEGNIMYGFNYDG
jgi:hypothetical protein